MFGKSRVYVYLCLIGWFAKQGKFGGVGVILSDRTDWFSSRRDQRPPAVRPPEATESQLCSEVFLRGWDT